MLFFAEVREPAFGIQRRNFIPLEDVAHAVEHFLFLEPSACEDGLFNLGGESTPKIVEIAEKIATRCKIVLGYTPEICRPTPSSNEVCDDFSFRIEKLKATGFCLLGDIDAEVDATLLLYRHAFGTNEQG